MPIEIKELVIKALITDEKSGEKGEFVIPEKQKLELVESCIERVLEIIKEKEEP